MDRLRIPANNSTILVELEPHIIIPKNNILTVYAGNGNIPVELSLIIFYHETE